MKISFQTKDESNATQLEDFLKLSKSDRIYSFIRLSESIISKFPVKNKVDKNKDNFIIYIKPNYKIQQTKRNTRYSTTSINKW
jgi:hypothetical protein